MNWLDLCSNYVSQALKTKQIGTPVAVRVVAHLVADHGLLERLTVVWLEEVSKWLNGQANQVTAMGSVETGQISTLTLFPGGQSALVALGSCGIGQPLLEVIVWGNRGILSWEPEGESEIGDSDNERELSEEATRLLHLIRKSMQGEEEANTLGIKTTSTKSRNPKPYKPPYGVLLVAGDHTHQPDYAKSLASDKRCHLVGLADEANVTARRRQLNEQLASRLGIPYFTDLSRAISRDDVQIVSVCAEPIRRGRIIVQAARADKHLYLDKPLAATLQDTQAIITAVNTAGVVSQMWSLVRSNVVQRIKNALQSEKFGELTAIHSDLCFAKGYAGTASLGQQRQETPLPNRYELPDSKREMSNVGVYLLVTLLWLTGKKVRRVRATTGNYFFQEHQNNDMEDFGQMLLELEGGLIATISVGRTGWKSYPTGGLHRTSLVGTKSTATFDSHRPRVAVWADVESWAAPLRDPEDPMGMWSGPKKEDYVAQSRQSWISPARELYPQDVEYFLDCIENGRQSDVSAELAAHATEILLAGYQSAASQQVVSLPG